MTTTPATPAANASGPPAVPDAPSVSGAGKRPGAFPLWSDGSPTSFTIHAVLALALLLGLHWKITHDVPFAIKQIGSSYLIFFYHFPSAITTFLFYAGMLAASIAFLVRRNPIWDRRAIAAAEVGVLSNVVLLLTGSTWAKAAWNHWWVWNDPRLMSAAIMSLMYAGYLVLQRSIEDADKRRTYAAILGILAFCNIPIVHFSIQWFGTVSHPPKFSALSDAVIIQTRWFGVLAFFTFYLVLYRWRFHRQVVRESVEESLQRIRRLEEARAPS